MLDPAALKAISPLDGRYQQACLELSPIASEMGLMRYRIQVEVEWLIALSQADDIPEVNKISDTTELTKLYQQFNVTQAERIKSIEKTTNHDVKAIEYFIKEQIKDTKLKEFVHFACTSEDINNIAYALMLKDLNKIAQKEFSSIIDQLTQLARIDTPMLARTHGQTASPTTVGKEIANVIYRLKRQLNALEQQPILAKINGAVGNFNAHAIAYPEVDWPALAQAFIEQLGLTYNPLTTQIEPHDMLAEHFHIISRLNSILIDFCRDVWGYISLGYFQQKAVAGEVGSSTMPHKVNPIDFENAEGNLGLSTAVLTFMANKLPRSRWQRDLTDSTVLRNLGVGYGYQHLALKSLQKGLKKLAIHPENLASDLDKSWEVLAEAIQTVMRRYSLPEPYEQLKALTRDKKVTKALLHQFIETLDIPASAKQSLLALTPATYIGLANPLCAHIQDK